MIPYSTQTIDTDDIKAVNRILKSNYLTSGPNVKKFEKMISKYTSSKYSLSFNSATSALHASCLALGLGKGDYFWTVPNSFVSSATCGLLCGAKVDFLDIDDDTFNLDIEKLNLIKTETTIDSFWADAKTIGKVNTAIMNKACSIRFQNIINPKDGDPPAFSLDLLKKTKP